MGAERQSGQLNLALRLFRNFCLGVVLAGVLVCGVAAVMQRPDWAAAAGVPALYALGMAALTHWALHMVGEEKASSGERGGGKG